jgi:hypothetical protein
MARSKKGMGEGVFCLLLALTAALLYANSLFGAFIWDDRAAVVKNRDVLGESPLSDLLLHDFWGTDITRADSHKSYRPLTVLSFRMDHAMHGLDAFGFHASNVALYVLTCLAVYAVMSQWINSAGARVAAVLFALHPVHTEAVASIVGRADVLCGLFYALALSTYTLTARLSLIPAKRSVWAVLLSALLAVVAYVFAAAAALSKEIGITGEHVERMPPQRQCTQPSHLPTIVANPFLSSHARVLSLHLQRLMSLPCSPAPRSQCWRSSLWWRWWCSCSQ